MIGARQSAGSMISNGGDNSPSNWVIAGRFPDFRVSLGLGRKSEPILPESGSFMWAALSVIAIILPSEKSRKAVGTGLKGVKTTSHHWSHGAFGYTNNRLHYPLHGHPFTRYLPSVGLSRRSDLSSRIRRQSE